MPPTPYTGNIVTDSQLVQIVDAALAQAAARAGAHLACYAGCAVCCFGPFPITLQDAQRLRQGWLHADPTLAAAIAQRATAARAQLATHFPGHAQSGLLDADSDEAAFAAHHQNLPCPVLDPNSGACSLYDARPLACRLNGLPSRIDGIDHPHCPLCFRHATAAEIEASRAVIDLRPHADSLVNSPPMRDDDLAPPRTVIAYAFGDALAT